MREHNKTLVVLLGPTGVGKTDLSIALARTLNSEIISSDSRQMYQGLTIGTAVPDPEQLASVKHHFIQNRTIFENYTAGMFEKEALGKLNNLFETSDFVCLVGGSGLYIDAVCSGLDIPGTDEEVRKYVFQIEEKGGLPALRAELRRLDPDICDIIDLRNSQRVMRALEICLTTGKTYSELRQQESKNRNFNILKIGLNLPRAELYERINLRVDKMLEAGLEEEARMMYPHKECNALKTVGYREFFDYFDNRIDKDEAIRLIKRNSRHYAKRQISWFGRYDDIHWFTPHDLNKIIELITQKR